MKIKPSFLAGSLLVGVVATMTTTPAQAFIFQRTNAYPQDIIGVTETFTDNLGRNLTGNSLSSPSFNLNSFSGNGTNSLTASFFGGSVPANAPVTVTTDIGDLPGNNSANFSVTQQAYVLTNGVPTPLPPYTLGFACSTQGNGTPYLATQATTNLPPGATNSVTGTASGILECQANTFGATASIPLSVQISNQSIPGYQTVGSLPAFPPAQTFNLQPGVATIISQPNVTSVPEPSSLFGLLAFGSLGVLTYFRRRVM